MNEEISLSGKGRNLFRTLVGLLIGFLAAVTIATPYFVWLAFFGHHLIWQALLIAFEVALGFGALIGAIALSTWVVCSATPQVKRFVAWLVPRWVLKSDSGPTLVDSKPKRPSAAEATPEPPEEDIDPSFRPVPSCAHRRPWLNDRRRFGHKNR